MGLKSKKLATLREINQCKDNITFVYKINHVTAQKLELNEPFSIFHHAYPTEQSQSRTNLHVQM